MSELAFPLANNRFPLGLPFLRTQRCVPLHQALPDKRYKVLLGLAFESFCNQHVRLIARKLYFSAVAYKCGPWFKKRTLQGFVWAIPWEI